MRSETKRANGAARGAAVSATALVAALTLLLALSVSHASATVIHPFLFSFGPDGTNDTAFASNEQIAIDPATHDVYVVDSGKRLNNKGSVYRFHEDGTPHNFTAGPNAGTNRLQGLTFSFPAGSPREGNDSTYEGQLAVAPPGAAGGTAGDLYVKGPSGVTIYSPEGALLGTLATDVCAVTVDEAGSVYVLDEADVITKYVPSANPVTSADLDSKLTGTGSGCAMAAGPGAIYVRHLVYYPSNAFQRCPLSLFPGGGGTADATGLCSTQAQLPDAWQFTVDAANGDLYAMREGGGALTWQYDVEGHLVSSFEAAEDTKEDWGHGIAVDSVSKKIFISNGIQQFNFLDPRKHVRVFGAGVTVDPPTVSIDAASSVTFKAAHLSGTVNSGGSGEYQKTTYRFACTPTCPGLEGDRSVPADGVDHAVSDDAEGLEPETDYEVTLIAENTTTGETAKDVTSFKTPAKPAAEPPAVTIDTVTSFTATTAHLTGTVDPKGSGELQQTGYRFEYSSNGLVWKQGEDQGPIEGSGPQAVSDDVSGLEPNTYYSVRLRAENVGGVAYSEPPDPSFTTDPAPPEVEATSATEVSSLSAQLNARVNPRNSETTYHFEWGTADCAANPCSSIPAGEDGEAGSGSEFVWVTAGLEGLSPSTTYHFRLVAENAGGKSESADRAFTTEAEGGVCPNDAARVGPSARLPECRAYEMVSPVEKNGANVVTSPLHSRSSVSGDAVSYVSTIAFPGSVGTTQPGNEYVSFRSAEGWTTRSITPYQKAPEFPSGFEISSYEALSPDLETGVFRALASVPGVSSGNVEGRTNLYLATGLRTGSPRFMLLSDASAPLGTAPQETYPHIQLVGASSDFAHVAFESTDNLTPDAGGLRPKLYEAVDGAVRLVGILPDSACGSPPCAAPESVGGATAGADLNFNEGTYTQQAHAVSADGSRVFFTAGSLKEWSSIGGRSYGYAGSLFMREGGESTVQIDRSERATPDPNGPGRSIFEAATPDGGLVYFLSKEELVDADTDGTKASLYRYDRGAPEGERLSLMPTPGTEPEHVVGISPDGSFVYLTGDPGELEKQGLYVLHHGEMKTIAIRGRGDAALGEYGNASGWTTEARLSGDGRTLLFASWSNLTGYDPHNPTACPRTAPPRNASGLCSELYLYRYDSDTLRCVSCNPRGEAPIGNASFQRFSEAGTARNPAEPTLNTPFSVDGRYVFFSTPDALVESDSNGKRDVYVYDAESEEARLITSGLCNCDALFLTASPDGSNVFFTTREQLVRLDTDDLVDAYDARVGGGLAAQNASPPARCEGDACQPVPSPPEAQTPASVGFAGPGDPVPTRKHGRKARKRHRRHAKHRHARKTRALQHNSRGGRR